MSSPAPFGPIAELFANSLNIRHVYGDPVRHGDTIVIPVAQVAYGFGAGGGRGGPGRRGTSARTEGSEHAQESAEGEGAGGGGGVRMTPVGALEIGPGGTRFVRFHPLRPWLGAAVAGLALAWLLARRGD
jgi:uncharacterized spore protein YtfJ